MTAFDGSGALGLLGENSIPQGTPDELRKVGVDPKKVGSCAPESPGVRGCQMEGKCIFGQARYGGFKGKGPRYIGYYKRDYEGAQKEDIIACYGFIQTLLPRMRAGEVAREEGKPHEQIDIVAQEGGWIDSNPLVQVNPADTKTPTADWKRNPHKKQVPKHPRPGENPQITYDQQLWAKAEARRKYEAEIQGLAYPGGGEPNEPIGGGDDDTVLEFDATKPGVAAEPVGKKAR